MPRAPRLTRPLLAAGLLALALACHGPRAREVRPQTVTLRLGHTEMALAVHSTKLAEPGYLVLHDNEETAVEAGLDALRDRGGRLVELRAQGARLVAFEAGGRTWRFNPNRVFTEAGAVESLSEHSGGAPPEALAEVRRFAGAVLAVYRAGSHQVMVALHNNSEGQFSAASYAPGSDLAGDAAAVHLPAGADPDDFFYVTERGLFDLLAIEGFPAVLQDSARVRDDGSLSVWAGRRGVPYVNVEAQHGHRARQVEMLDALARALTRLSSQDRLARGAQGGALCCRN